MVKGEAAAARASRGIAGIAVVTLLGAWWAPALASSGVSLDCDETDSALPASATAATVPKLAVHTDAALQDILDSDNVKLPALTSVAAESNEDDPEESEVGEEAAIRGTDTPAITTRTPGISDASLPSFRRKMLRTDI